MTLARASLLAAQRAEDDTILRAPFSGVITTKNAQPGEMISPMATSGFTRTGVGTIVDMASLEAEVDVSESFLERVSPGTARACGLSRVIAKAPPALRTLKPQTHPTPDTSHLPAVPFTLQS